MTIYIPSQGEVVSPTVLVVQHGLLNQSNVELGADWQVSSNTANAKQLESLPHVGPAAAEKIINARPFGSLEELVQKKALSQKTFDKIKDKLML